mmetsp:Transcript_36714/g.84720  ORF Transcript_36714/g.84720 Transcript_36714/m.84720 type:complete len:97 (+) Transcript_36714:66-356(+)
MAARPVVLPAILALAALLCATCFVGGRFASAAPRGATTASAAVPESVELSSSITTALEVSTPGWWANIVTLVVPIAILITLYLQSERNKFEAMQKK